MCNKIYRYIESDRTTHYLIGNSISTYANYNYGHFHVKICSDLNPKELIELNFGSKLEDIRDILLLNEDDLNSINEYFLKIFNEEFEKELNKRSPIVNLNAVFEDICDRAIYYAGIIISGHKERENPSNSEIEAGDSENLQDNRQIETPSVKEDEKTVRFSKKERIKILKKFEKSTLTQKEFAKLYNIHPSTLKVWRRQYNFHSERIKKGSKYSETIRTQVLEMHFKQGLSKGQISKKLNIPESTIQNWLQTYKKQLTPGND